MLSVFEGGVGKELAMVIAIDAVRYDAKLKGAPGWQTGIADYIPAEERQQPSGMAAPARGVLCGLLISGAMWFVLVIAARAVVSMMR
jgi:hypothetical protein